VSKNGGMVFFTADADRHRVIKTQTLTDDHCQYFLYQVSRCSRWSYTADSRRLSEVWRPYIPQMSFTGIWNPRISYWMRIATSKWAEETPSVYSHSWRSRRSAILVSLDLQLLHHLMLVQMVVEVSWRNT